MRRPEIPGRLGRRSGTRTVVHRWYSVGTGGDVPASRTPAGDVRRNELGEFLKARRAELSPSDVGLPDVGGRRRVNRGQARLRN
jgi:hypothetical protein